MTFADIPEAANDYKVNGRSPLEWIIDRYQGALRHPLHTRSRRQSSCRISPLAARRVLLHRSRVKTAVRRLKDKIGGKREISLAERRDRSPEYY